MRMKLTGRSSDTSLGAFDIVECEHCGHDDTVVCGADPSKLKCRKCKKGSNDDMR